MNRPVRTALALSRRSVGIIVLPFSGLFRCGGAHSEYRRNGVSVQRMYPQQKGRVFPPSVVFGWSIIRRPCRCSFVRFSKSDRDKGSEGEMLPASRANEGFVPVCARGRSIHFGGWPPVGMVGGSLLSLSNFIQAW